MSKLVDIKEASDLLGVNTKTLRRWDNEGKLKAKYRTAGGHRRYNVDDIDEYLGNNQIQKQTNQLERDKDSENNNTSNTDQHIRRA